MIVYQRSNHLQSIKSKLTLWQNQHLTSELIKVVSQSMMCLGSKVINFVTYLAPKPYPYIQYKLLILSAKYLIYLYACIYTHVHKYAHVCVYILCVQHVCPIKIGKHFDKYKVCLYLHISSGLVLLTFVLLETFCRFQQSVQLQLTG